MSSGPQTERPEPPDPGADRAIRLLLIADAPPAAQGMGAYRTLFNVFKSWPEDLVGLVTWKTASGPGTVARPFAKNLFTVRCDPLPTPGRFRPVLRNKLRAVYDWWFKFSARKIRRKLAAFSPEVVVVYSESGELHRLAAALFADGNVPVLFFLMDDLIDPHGRSVTREARSFFARADGWLVISHPLAATIAARWQIPVPPPLAIVHNPIEVSQALPIVTPVKLGLPIRIAYAGSIWPMHLDALRTAGEGVKLLRQRGIDAEILVYTGESFWQRNQADLAQDCFRYMGFRTPDVLPRELQQASLLLVCSAFDPAFESVSRSSFQTKVVDYLSVGRPVLGIGPEYSICNHFLRERNCGLTFEVADPARLADFLEKLFRAQTDLTDYVMTGRNIALQEFSAEEMTRRIKRLCGSILDGRHEQAMLSRARPPGR